MAAPEFSPGRTYLIENHLVFTDAGAALVVKVLNDGVDLRDPFGCITHTHYWDLSTILNIEGGDIAALSESLRPQWDALDDAARAATLTKLEIVQEIYTGYRDGHPELARPGEPHHPFGPFFKMSLTARCQAMAVQLNRHRQSDYPVQRRVRDGEIQSAGISPSTLGNWMRNWERHGILGLIDGRSTHTPTSWDRIDEDFRKAFERQINMLDGDTSTVSIQELERRARAELLKEGITDPRTPQRLTQQYMSWTKHKRGETTRAQRSAAQREVSGTRQFAAVRPGQVVAIDATNADNLVYDALSGKAVSVQILTAIDVATRVILALRVVPLSANSQDTLMLIYDICRPFAMTVDGTDVSNWRWCGLPEAIDLSTCQRDSAPRLSVAPDLINPNGEHFVPSVLPDGIHVDLGSNFHSLPVRELLGTLGIDLLPSRGGKPTDNPHVERWHESLQRGLQRLPGYKGRNVLQRGRFVAEEPLVTASFLQNYLRQWIALDYHRRPHEGFVLPSRSKEEIQAQLCPLEIWDIYTEATGRIDGVCCTDG
ncbi:putative transposase [Mycobacterium sp. OTB74]|jgi:transposase InsO family protein|nr:putative transposase [Mycobacterium sp. OTB74]